jgi:hypothetical protein
MKFGKKDDVYMIYKNGNPSYEIFTFYLDKVDKSKISRFFSKWENEWDNLKNHFISKENEKKISKSIEKIFFKFKDNIDEKLIIKRENGYMIISPLSEIENKDIEEIKIKCFKIDKPLIIKEDTNFPVKFNCEYKKVEETNRINDSIKPAVVQKTNTKLSENLIKDIQPPTPKQSSIASLQKIFFGPPGTGKSYKAKKLKEILKEKDDELIIIRATFHPEYLNSDFIAKLVPVTNGEKVEYKVLPGHFVKAFAKALANPEKHVLLIIEEINRGNCSAIFGEVFQLLDRNDNGESVYENEWSDLAKIAIKEEMEKVKKGSYNEAKIKKIPANMSIVATMNTCDENIFFMDSAFKRRWGFEYVGIEYESSDDDHKKQLNAKIEDGTGNITWKDFLKKLNSFIKGSKAYRLEDKLVGQWFIKAKDDKISKDDIKNKLMHYLWDNVFSRDRKPLIGLLEDDKPGTVDLKTFGDFIEKYDVFIEKIMKIKIESK